MTQVVKLKRSATPGKVPTTADLELGEIAINTYDGKLYFEKDSGTPAIVSVATSTDLASKQDTLVSGTNIKTINGNTLLGTGDLVISGGSSIPVSDEGTQITTGVTSLNFTGAGITASAAGNAVTVNVPGGGGSSTLTIQNKTAAYTVVAGDNGTIINCNHFSAFTVSLTAAATLGAGFNCWIWCQDAAITIDPNGSEAIDGVSTLVLRQGEGTQIICDGTNWQTGGKKTMRMYAENLSASFARPIASSGGALALGYNSRSSVAAQASNSAAVAISGNASGSSSTAVGNGASATANNASAFGYSTTASGSNASAIGSSTTASASNSTAIGLNSGTAGSQAVTGSGAMALGGSYASGTDSFAAAVANNTSSYGATGANSVAIGALSKSFSTGTIAIGESAYAYGNGYGIALGKQATSSGTGSVCIASENAGSTASGRASVVIGAQSAASADHSFAFGKEASSAVYGKFSYASTAFVAAGDAQTGALVLRRATTDATATVLTSNNAAAAATNQVILPNNSAYAFSGIIVARQQAAGGTASAAWRVEGLIRREANAASTVLVNSALTVIDNQPGWSIALSADTTNGGLAVTVTGAAATNIRWVATIQTSEVTYA